MTRKASDPTFAQILKRRRWTAQDAEAVLSTWRESGESLSRFARRHGLDAWRLMRWRRLLDKQGAIQFHRVKVVSSSSRAVTPAGETLELVLRDGRRVAVRRGFDALLLEDLVRTVESWPC
jgi:transposase-like protein